MYLAQDNDSCVDDANIENTSIKKGNSSKEEIYSNDGNSNIENEFSNPEHKNNIDQASNYE